MSTRGSDERCGLGVRPYWTVKPVGEALVAYRLVDGGYTQVGRAEGEELFEVDDPFPVRLRPAALFGGAPPPDHR